MAQPRKLSVHEETLWLWLQHGHPHTWVREFRFHPDRLWPFDFANVPMRLAVEVDGVVYGYKKGGHQTPSGIERDREKDAEAMILGWQVLRVTPKQLASGIAYQWIEELTHTGGRISS